MKNREILISFKNSETIDVSNLLELALTNLGYSKKRIIRYSFLIEEALEIWREMLPPDADLTVLRQDTPSNARFIFELEGGKVNPFDIKLSADDDFNMTNVTDRLLSGVGSEMKYSYRKGKNRIILSLPKIKHETRIFRRTVLLLMIPLTIQALMESVATNIDTLMLGFTDSASMSAVSLASVFFTIPNILITAITVGATALMSQYWGKRDREGVNRVASLTLMIALICSGIAFIAMFFFPSQIMGIYSNDSEIISIGAVYLRFLAFSIIISAVFRMLFCFLQVLGNVKQSLVFSLAGCLANVVFNSLFIFAFRLGAKGAALATIISGLIQVVLSGAALAKKKLVKLKLSFGNTENLKTFFSSAAPVALQMTVWVIANNIITTAFGHMNRDILSANSVLIVLSEFILSAKVGFGRSVGLLTGAYLGRNELDEIKERSKDSYGFAALVAAICVPVFVGAGFIIRLLPMDFTEGALEYMVPMLLAYGVSIFFTFLNNYIIYGFIFVGGDAKGILVIDTIIMWGVMVPLSFIGRFTSVFPELLFIILLKCDEIIKYPLFHIRLRKMKWLKNLTK